MNEVWTSEQQLRAWMREQWGARLRFIEPAIGSTLGLPDCFLQLGRNTHWFELKKGEFKRGRLLYELTPEQKRELPRLVNDGAWVRIVIAVLGTRVLLSVRVNEESVSGKLSPSFLGDAKLCLHQTMDTGMVLSVESQKK